MHGKRTLILSLKLILAGNGTILMDRFLVQLANVANKHDVYFHIDKVFTAGRMEHSFLLTQSKPVNFIARVSTLSMGKWRGVGLALVHKDLRTHEYDHSGK
jgi:cysteine sulfinate desulfinase/cysteine desulfurase-like protein